MKSWTGRLLLIGLLILCAAPRDSHGQSRKPNIIIILADDLGWSDLGAYGAGRIRTPELDRLAAGGVRFDQFYSASAVCSPSRAALLTGRYPFRSGITRVLHPGSQKGIPASERLLSEMLGEAGYRTGLIGKWHLGDAPEYLPLQHGFDEFQGIPYSNNMHPLYFMEGNQKLKSPEPIPAHMTSRFTEQAKDFIQRHREVPFFLLLAHPMPHYPIDSAGTWRGSSRDGRYGDVVQELDWSVGQIVACLENLGLADDSVLFFTSDNGSWRGRSNRPLRGKKRTGWEGGFRVPLIAWAPGRFQSGTVTDRPSMMFDLYSTSLRLAGVEPPSDLAIDGKSLLPLMDGSPSGPGDRAPLDALFFFRYGQINAVRAGRWKLHVGRTSPLFGRRGIGELYDLTEDLKEQINLANRRPGVVEHLTHEIENFEWGLGTILNRE